MKKILLIAYCSVLFLNNVNAQKQESEEEPEQKSGLKKENLFVGGTLGLGFGSGSFSLGVGPYFGYSINKYVDVALSLNYNYFSQRDFYFLDDKLRQSIIGPGAFVRVYPVKFLFAHAQYEQNFLKSKYFLPQNQGGEISKQTYNVGSLLIGPGFASGRDEDSKTFYYISVLFDVLKKPNSPYVDGLGRIDPVIRAGFNVALFQGDGGGGRNRSSRGEDRRMRF